MNINNENITEVKDPYYSGSKKASTISFDIILWLYRILKYWYLFAISIAICMSFAYLKNKSWIASYSSQAMIILEVRGGSSVVRGAVPVATMLQNASNQQSLLKSYGMTERAISRLPKHMSINYYRQTPFKIDDLYATTPVRVEAIEFKDAYGYHFDVNPIDDNKCKITYTDKEGVEINIEATYGKTITTDIFKVVLQKTDHEGANFVPFKFQFLSKDALIGMFHGRVASAMAPQQSSILTLFISGTQPQRDVDYLNALLKEFQDYNLDLKNEQADLTINFLNKQLGIINDSLHSSRIALDLFQKETGVYEVTSSNLRQEIDVAEQEKKVLSIKERSILIFTEKISQTIMEDVKLIDPTELGLEGGGEIATLVTEYNDILDKAKYMGPKSPLYNKTTDQLNTLRVNIVKDLQRMQNMLQEEKDLLIDKFKILDLKIDNLPPQERDLVRYQREYNVNEMYHQFLTQKRYEAEIQKASNTPDNFIWEAPRQVGGAGNTGILGKNYMFWLLIGSIIPLIFVILKEEILNYTIATKEECEKLSGLPVIGTIENISSKLKAGPVLVKNYPKSSFAEAFRNIRVRLEYMAKKQSNISMLVTSAEPADGKTFIATNIASVYQLMQKRVIVLDLDLRRPSVASTLEIEGGRRGVSNYLIGQVELKDIIFTHPDYDFDVIPAGTLPPNPSELIKTAKTQELIEYLKTVYDYVIIDCSPVGLVSDAYVLANLVDTTLFAVRRGKTNKSFFKSVIEQMKFDGINNISIVFNDVKGREGYYGTSRYYGDKSYYLRKNSYYHDDYFEN